MKYHEKVQEIIDKVKTGEIEPIHYKIQIDYDLFTYISFYYNKQIRYIQNWKNGKLHGKCRGWNEDSTKKYVRIYKNGELIEEENNEISRKSTRNNRQG